MKRSGPIKRRTPIKRTPSRGKSSNRQKIPSKVRENVERRAGFQCEASTKVCRGKGEHCHHVLMRSAGGKHTEDNLILVCQPCHHFIHHNPELSYERGWLRRRQAAI